MSQDIRRSWHWRWIPALLAVPLLIDCGRPDTGLVSFGGLTMGTSYSVHIVESVPGTLDAEIIQRDVAGLLAGLEGRLSIFEPASEIAGFNKIGSPGWYDVSEETAEVIALALKLGRDTGGAFDITVGPFVDLWGFGPSREPAGIPSGEEIRELLFSRGSSALSVQKIPPALRKTDPGLKVDLGGIAKGYGVDRISALLESRGIRDYLIEIGGEVRTSGLNARGSPWKVGIAAPKGSGMARTLKMSSAAAATSGSGPNSFVLNGKRYSHLIDPASGKPSSEAAASVTVIDRSCARADGLATALAVLGIEKGFELALDKGWSAYFIGRSEGAWTSKVTPSFTDFIREEPDTGNGKEPS